jgi:ribonuclease HI
MQDYIDVGIGNYALFDEEYHNISKQEGENYFEGFWNMSFDGACSKSGSGVEIVFKNPNSVIYPHTIILEFICTNNEVEYESLIQGMNLALEIKIEHLRVTNDYELVINHIKKKCKIKKEKLKFMRK